jgi:hypothetical protein
MIYLLRGRLSCQRRRVLPLPANSLLMQADSAAGHPRRPKKARPPGPGLRFGQGIAPPEGRLRAVGRLLDRPGRGIDLIARSNPTA